MKQKEKVRNINKRDKPRAGQKKGRQRLMRAATLVISQILRFKFVADKTLLSYTTQNAAVANSLECH